ncbi:formate dehydrogenase accessory sulfurtransferase FdhD [Ochrobactrum pecoris]|uniref:Sulfur carrier protein FdhD n=1 Tax=Brucella pecoris TaxID=867683 RepID=A0A5C5CVG7_9HYPH|nr:formate dehydrogenase accessory sulfurtransferase FdhD [Brucella pecoris]MBB4092166.1 FdhD protein [Brucella pecoris]NKW82110.1 formate dehydrogenase accessory sulfurtransferase FdhD [Brucella pecoris]TNV15400.1 formate dehydrogenase accessory sulfurtransferase FdhD [Brucella pecoris]
MTIHKVSQSATRLAHRVSSFHKGTRMVPEEVPVAVSYNGSTQAVMMATPDNLEDFAIGFTLTENIVDHISEIEAIEVVAFEKGIDVQIRLSERPEQRLAARRRFMAGPVGCGLCGIDSIDHALRPLGVLDRDGGKFTSHDISMAVKSLAERQELNAQTHAVHAAGFYVPGEGLIAVREDVGRHNALDKLVGAVSRIGASPQDGIVAITSRVSVEMVQKAVMFGTFVLAAISAPTALAIRTAEEANLTLVALVRGDEFDIYAHEDRIAGE